MARPRKSKNTDQLEKCKINFLLDGIEPTVSPDLKWHWFTWDKSQQKQLWDELKEGILEKWVKDHPGTRPAAWWEFDAPGARLKLSEAGPTNEELEECCCSVHLGIPDYYDDPHQLDQDKPVFESQAAFLERHGLLEVGEIQK